MPKAVFRAGVDWGSSSFRAYQFTDNGELADSLESPMGIKFCKNQSFEQTFFDSIGDWLHPGDSVALSGMITSKQGWIESEYLQCPADLSSLSANATLRQFREINFLFLPGVSQNEPPDIMRGEELQLLGANMDSDRYVAIIPGTHSKWINVEHKVVRSFRTIASGELYELLINHSLIGSFANRGCWNNDVFLQAVEKGFDSQSIISDLFYCRSAVILSGLPKPYANSYLSGLLIGNEVREGLIHCRGEMESIVVIASERLGEKYQRALSHLGFSPNVKQSQSAVRGYQSLIGS